MSLLAGLPYLGIYVNICVRVMVLLHAFVCTIICFTQAPTLSAVRLLRIAVALGTPGGGTYGGDCNEEAKCRIEISRPLH